MIRIVGRLVRNVAEERFAILPVRLDVTDHLVGIGLRSVVVLGQFFQVAAILGESGFRSVGAEIRHVPVAARAVEQREVTLESARGGDLVGLLPHVPFAGHIGVVAGVLQQLWQGGDTVVEVAFVAVHAPLVGRRHLVHVAQAVEMRVRAAEQHGSRWRTTGVRVELRAAHPGFGERIQVRSLNLAAEAAQVRIAEIIAENDHDVWSLAGSGGGCGGSLRDGGGISQHANYCDGEYVFCFHTILALCERRFSGFISGA